LPVQVRQNRKKIQEDADKYPVYNRQKNKSRQHNNTEMIFNSFKLFKSYFLLSTTSAKF